MFEPTIFWRIFSDILVALALLDCATLALTALYQWIHRKSFKKIDRELRWTLLPFSLMTVTYVIFEKFLILNTRPPASGLPWEPSFPSTHTMLTATIFFVTIILLPKYLKSRTAYLNLSAAMLLAIILVAIGRVLANMHWVSDVIGGILFSAIFAVIYALALRYTAPKPQKTSKNTQLPKPTPKSK